MKQLFTQIALGALLMLLGTSSIAQNLYVGHRGNGSTAQDSLEVIDTTGGAFVIVDTKYLVTDAGDGNVEGLYGMAVDPFTGEMYCVYGYDGGGSSGRRLGILTVTDSTANIADIDSLGTVQDISFMDSTLFGSTGSAGEFMFGKINKTTAEFTEMFQHSNDGTSSGFTFDYYKQRFLKTTQGASAYEVIDAITFEQTSLSNSPFGHPGWTTTLLTINDSTCFSMGNTTANYLNTNTFEYTVAGTFVSSEYVHSSAFASLPLSLWAEAPSRNVCVGDSIKLVVVNGTGTDYEWYRDGILVDGASDSVYYALVGGDYQAFVDGDKTNSVFLSVVDVAASFVVSDNPVYLGGAASVDVNFYETATGDEISYSWDSGNGETSTEENPIFSYETVGTYDASLVVTDDFSGCTKTAMQTIEVIAGSLGINDFEINFDLYPVPAVDVLTVKYTGDDSYTVELVDINGAIVSNHVITPQGENTIDVKELAAGTYFLNISNGKEVSKRKFVKQ